MKKIYNKEAFLMLIFDLGILLLATWDFYKHGPAARNVAVLIYVCSSLKRNTKYAFIEEESKQMQIEYEKQKTAYKNVFGRFAPFAPFSFFIFLGVGLLLLKLLPGRMLGFYVIIFGMFSPMLTDAIISSERHRMENERKEEKHESI